MDNAEARAELSRIVSEYRHKPYAFWVSLIDSEPITFELTTARGRWYQVEIQAFWDDAPGGDVRVLFSIDDGGWRAWMPMGDDFIIAQDGSFVGE